MYPPPFICCPPHRSSGDSPPIASCSNVANDKTLRHNVLVGCEAGSSRGHEAKISALFAECPSNLGGASSRQKGSGGVQKHLHVTICTMRSLLLPKTFLARTVRQRPCKDKNNLPVGPAWQNYLGAPAQLTLYCLHRYYEASETQKMQNVLCISANRFSCAGLGPRIEPLSYVGEATSPILMTAL